jgi:glycosyltransferase involved in cell wall biosynthesis
MKQILLSLRKRAAVLWPSRRTVNILTRAGRAIGRSWPRKNSSGLFFFFPFYQVGGAEKIHADIIACVADQKPYLFFTNRSKDQKFKSLFEKSGRVFDLSSLINNRYAYYLYLGALSSFINRHERAVVFGCNSVFFYHLLPHLRKDVRRLDLIHAFGGDIEHVSLPFVHEIDARVVYSSRAFSDLKHQYSSQGIDLKLLNRITFIDNQVAIPETRAEKPERGRLRVIYVGRGAEEKRVHLIGRAADECRRTGVPAEFIFVGDVAGAIEIEHRDACIFKGEIGRFDELEKIYNEADVLVLTSRSEGFPVVIMEAMAHGVVSVSTDVGGIADHLKDGVNGLLIRAEDEAEIVASLVTLVEQLAADRDSLSQMSRNAYDYARQHFGPLKFCEAYRRLILDGTEMTGAT